MARSLTPLEEEQANGTKAMGGLFLYCFKDTCCQKTHGMGCGTNDKQQRLKIEDLKKSLALNGLVIKAREALSLRGELPGG